jgi:hypothetical protein
VSGVSPETFCAAGKTGSIAVVIAMLTRSKAFWCYDFSFAYAGPFRFKLRACYGFEGG